MATIVLHKNARTTPAIRREIQQSKLSERALARKYGLNRATGASGKGGRRWKTTHTQKPSTLP